MCLRLCPGHALTERAPDGHCRLKKRRRRNRYKTKVGKVTQDQLRSIAEEKVKELTGHSTEAMMRTIAGTARSMGIDVVD